VKNIRYRAICLALALPVLAIAADAAAAGGKERSTRGRLVHEIVSKWGNHVQEAYRTDARRWAMEMVPAFSRVSIDSLAKAARAKTFMGMNDALLGDAAAPHFPNLAVAVGSGALPLPEKALGDAANDLVFVAVSPCRILDTRVAGGVITAGSTRNFDITDIGDFAPQGGATGDCGVGGVGAFAAAVINFTVVSPSSGGYITAFPYLGTQPLASTLNYGTNDIRGNLAIVKLDQGSSVPEMSVYSFAQTHLVADITGYFINPQATNLNCTNTSVQTFNLAANSVNFFNNPNCPAGYTAVTPYCWTAASGVYSQGSGYNANATGNSTFCSWQNTTASSQSVFGGNVCCRVPGR